MGISPRRYIEECRVALLKLRLARGEPVIGALRGAGYSSHSWLYKDSRVKLGMTPANYKSGGAGRLLMYAIGDSKLGRLLVAATSHGICSVNVGEDDARLVDSLRQEYPKARIVRVGEGSPPPQEGRSPPAGPSGEAAPRYTRDRLPAQGVGGPYADTCRLDELLLPGGRDDRRAQGGPRGRQRVCFKPRAPDNPLPPGGKVRRSRRGRVQARSPEEEGAPSERALPRRGGTGVGVRPVVGQESTARGASQRSPRRPPSSSKTSDRVVVGVHDVSSLSSSTTLRKRSSSNRLSGLSREACTALRVSDLANLSSSLGSSSRSSLRLPHAPDGPLHHPLEQRIVVEKFVKPPLVLFGEGSS